MYIYICVCEWNQTDSDYLHHKEKYTFPEIKHFKDLEIDIIKKEL